MLYARRVPALSFTESKGLSSKDLNDLMNGMTTLAKQNVGEEIVYQLVQYAEVI